MSYIDDLNDAATRAQAATVLAEAAVQIIDDVANGNSSTQVSTSSGPVDTVAKAVNDLKNSFVDAVLSAEREEQTLSSGQTSVILSSITLNARPLMFIEGSFEEDFTVTSDTEVTLGQSYPEGTRVWFLQNVAVTDAETQFVNTLGTTMTIDPTVLGAKTLGSASDNTVKLTVGSTDYYIPAYTTAPV